jgi:putative membrane protein
MIVKENLPWLRMLFSVRGSDLARTAPRILFVTLVALAATAFQMLLDVEEYTLTPTPFTLIGLALGIFLGFRNNAAYDRYWEARKLWGSLVNESRTFARQVLTFLHNREKPPAGEDERRALQETLVRYQIAYVHALRHHLRESDPTEDLARHLSPEFVAYLKTQRNVPIAILLAAGKNLESAWQRGWLGEFQRPTLERTLTGLTDVQGGCERIKNTPIPWAYTVLIHRLVAFYCVFLPFGIVSSAGWLTPVVVFLIAHAFFGLDEIGDEIEQPFGTEPQHLPLSALSRMIEVNLLQAIDAPDIPPLLQPVDGILN